MRCITHKHVARLRKSSEFLSDKSWEPFLDRTPARPSGRKSIVAMYRKHGSRLSFVAMLCTLSFVTGMNDPIEQMNDRADERRPEDLQEARYVMFDSSSFLLRSG